MIEKASALQPTSMKKRKKKKKATVVQFMR